MEIERPPHISKKDLFSAMLHQPSAHVGDMIDKINETFEYWDSIKYKKCPTGCTPQQLWTFVKAARRISSIKVWDKYDVRLSLTNSMQKTCHQFDMYWGGSWGNNSIIDTNNKEQYLISSLMEEAIYSSQMEGAATTRKVAKEMLRKKMTPRDKSQQMIHNNYQTIQYIVEHKDEPLSEELLLQIHRLMTDNTMQNPEDAGRFRNNKNPRQFIHPIIRGIVIHFMISFVHPFVDGNGRTARAIFFWYMLREGYWLTEYLSISRVIAKSKKAYEKAFLYTEADGMDIGYFVAYNLKVLEQSFQQLQNYIKRKQEEKNAASLFLRMGNFNERQAQIIKLFADDPNILLTIKDLEVRFGVSPTTAKTDIIGLLEKNIVSEISLNKVKRAYVKGDGLDEILSKK